MVTILIAPDKFKGSLSAQEVCCAIQKGIETQKLRAKIICSPLADGGEGTTDILTEHSRGKKITLQVKGPLFDSISADYGLSADGKTAFIEMAKASGLQLLPKEKRNPLYTTTVGTGQLILDALERGVNEIILCIGGSATNDAGIGMASALGYGFYDAVGNPLLPTGQNLVHLDTIDLQHIHPRLNAVRFITLCDVTNPLFGHNGAAFIYAPQKGADEVTVKRLDDGLRNFASVSAKTFAMSANFNGAGAAGGLGAGAKIFLRSTMQKGIDYMDTVTGLTKKVQDSDLVITGEGKIDEQTLSGKVVMHVAQIASAFAKPVIAVCGKLELVQADLIKMGVRQVISLADDKITEQEAMQHAKRILEEKVASARLL